MAASIGHEAIEKATGKSWSEWLVFFESIGAPQLNHKEIAQKAGDLGGAPPWWRQMVTVAYEQHIGRRVSGQDCNGQFSVSASKTIVGTLDVALEIWKTKAKGHTEFSDVPISRAPELSQTEKWRYWRCGLSDGSRISVNFSAKPQGKAVISIQHERLESMEQVEHWRKFWKEFINR
jgi:hypothetical protein